MNKRLTGLNIQWPWSELIVTGSKSIETRSYPLPDRLRGCEIALIETPGKFKHRRKLKSKIIAIIVFSGSKKYLNETCFRLDIGLHRIIENDRAFWFGQRKETWGWHIESVVRLPVPVDPPVKRGIVYARDCIVPSLTPK